MTKTPEETLAAHLAGYRWMGATGLPSLTTEQDAVILAAIALVPGLPRCKGKNAGFNGNNLRGLERKTCNTLRKLGVADSCSQAQAIAYTANRIHESEGCNIRF